MASRLWIDTETFSEVSIREGTDRYTRAAEIMLVQYALDDGPVAVWDRTANNTMPADLQWCLADDDIELWAHNAQFDAAVLHYNGMHVKQKRWRCTMIQAMAHSLPGALGTLCTIFGVPDDKAKSKDGRALIRLFCMPTKFSHSLKQENYATKKEFKAAVAAAKEAWPGRATRHTHPEEWQRFGWVYGVSDIEAMRFVAKQMPTWNYPGRELALWQRDGMINRRGFAVDVDFVDAAIKTAEAAVIDLNAKTADITGGEVGATTQRDKLLQHLLQAYDVFLPDMRAATVEAYLKDHGEDIPRPVRELLANRLQASSTSVGKYKKVRSLVGPDGRCRYTMQIYGALRTGRWAGRGFQPHNMPRPVLKNKAILEGIAAIKHGLGNAFYSNVMEVLSSAVRGCIVAADGCKLAVADLANIEGRGLAYLAGEKWKLEAFSAYDTVLTTSGSWLTGPEVVALTLEGRPPALVEDKKGENERKGHDLYALAYARAMGVTPQQVMENKSTGDGSWRQIGKVMELGLGYEGGVGAFLTFALVYGLDLEAMARGAISTLPGWVRAESTNAYQWAQQNGRTYGLPEETYVVCDAFKRMWRAAHPMTVKLWKACEDLSRAAIHSPGKVFTYRSLKFVKQGTWLRVQLPSGRSLCYPGARVGEDGKLCYQGINQFSRKWQTIRTYSGKIAENITQAFARDVLAYNMPAIEQDGYPIVLSVHDELLTEPVNDPKYSHLHLAARMAVVPHWAPGLPLAAAGYEDLRYRKG